MKWIATCHRKPPIGEVVRVSWVPNLLSAVKRAKWDGRNWLTPRNAGIFEEEPTYWLEVPPEPEPPVCYPEPKPQEGGGE